MEQPFGTACHVHILHKGESKQIITPEQAEYIKNFPIEHAVVLEDGTTGGQPSVTFLARLPNGKYISIETTGKIIATIGAVVNTLIPEGA